jgi:TatA/E family protein of Tat protein translocase
VFNIGPTELIVIVIIALIVFGPRRLPEIGRTVGKSLREFRRASQDLRDELNINLSGDELPGDRPAPDEPGYEKWQAGDPLPSANGGPAGTGHEATSEPEPSSSERPTVQSEPAPAAEGLVEGTSPGEPEPSGEEPDSLEPSPEEPVETPVDTPEAPVDTLGAPVETPEDQAPTAADESRPEPVDDGRAERAEPERGTSSIREAAWTRQVWARPEAPAGQPLGGDTGSEAAG